MYSSLVYKNDHITLCHKACKACWGKELETGYFDMCKFIENRVKVGHESVLEHSNVVIEIVKDYDFEGKKIVTFCTFGSGGLEPAMADLKAALPKAEVAEHGFGIRNARISATEKELNRFLIEYGYMEGSVDALPGYSELQPVTEEEKLIFDAACSDYQYPLGTPIMAGKRGTPDGVDYIYQVESRGVTCTIYVTVGNEEGAKPEFTRVVR